MGGLAAGPTTPERMLPPAHALPAIPERTLPPDKSTLPVRSGMPAAAAALLTQCRLLVQHQPSVRWVLGTWGVLTTPTPVGPGGNRTHHPAGIHVTTTRHHTLTTPPTHRSDPSRVWRGPAQQPTQQAFAGMLVRHQAPTTPNSPLRPQVWRGLYEPFGRHQLLRIPLPLGRVGGGWGGAAAAAA